MSKRKRYTAEQIIPKLREAEVLLSQGSTQDLAAKKIGVSTQTLIRWRKEYGGLRMDQARRLKDLERENARLKRLLADADHVTRRAEDVVLELEQRVREANTQIERLVGVQQTTELALRLGRVDCLLPLGATVVGILGQQILTAPQIAERTGARQPGRRRQRHLFGDPQAVGVVGGRLHESAWLGEGQPAILIVPGMGREVIARIFDRRLIAGRVVAVGRRPAAVVARRHAIRVAVDRVGRPRRR